MLSFPVPAAVLFCLAMLASAPRTAAAAQSFDGCAGFIDSVPATISTQGVWCLRRDLSTPITSGAAITIAANNVTIDCNDFKLGGLAAGIATNTAGIAAHGRLNTTVRRCNLCGFLRGVDIRGDGTRIEDNRFEANTSIGIALAGDGTVVRDNTVVDTGGRRVPLFPQDSTSHYVVGIYLQGGTHVAGNTVSGVDAGDDALTTSLMGILLYTGDGSVVERNLVRGLAGSGEQYPWGIVIAASSRALAIDNRVSALTAARGAGIACDSSSAGARGNLVWGFSQIFGASCIGTPDGSNHRF